MAITFVASANNVAAPGSTAMSVPMPTGYIAGDVLLVGIWNGTGGNDPITAPAGWTAVADQNTSEGFKLRVWYKVATGSEGTSQTFTVTVAGVDYARTSVAYRGAAANSYVAASNASSGNVSSWTSPSYSALVPDAAVSFFAGDPGTPDGGSTDRAPGDSPSVFDKVTGPGTTSGTTVTTGSPSSQTAVTIGLRPENSAPYAPTLGTMASGGVIDVGAVNRATHIFSDPDSSLPRPEGQSGFDIRYRIIGAPGWTTISKPASTNQFYDFTVGVDGFAGFTANNYERQVRTYDLAGAVGPYSSSGFFTAAVAPPAPTITAPTLDQTITSVNFLVQWTVTTQTAYRVRTVGDISGSPDTSVVYFDSGVIADSGARQATATFGVTNRIEHVQVQVFDGTLWSAWSSKRINVDYVEPPAPVVNLAVDVLHGALLVSYATPAPTGGQPTPTSVNIWINDGKDIPDEPKVTGLPINGTWSYPTPRSSHDYTLHVHAITTTADGIPSSPVGVLTIILDSATRGVLDQNVLA